MLCIPVKYSPRLFKVADRVVSDSLCALSINLLGLFFVDEIKERKEFKLSREDIPNISNLINKLKKVVNCTYFTVNRSMG